MSPDIHYLTVLECLKGRKMFYIGYRYGLFLARKIMDIGIGQIYYRCFPNNKVGNKMEHR